ncbi:MAG: four helix bundle protein [Nitrospira sp. CG24E]|nr:MAG: four helix bundle protein [Nitrospira sp. CG24E]
MEGAEDKQSSIRTFEDLDVWKVCRDLRVQIATIARTFPKEEQYRLWDQLVRASRSVTANLAEGYGRFHYAENVQFARQARGSLYEVIDHLTVAQEEKLIADETVTLMREGVLRAVLVVNGFIRYLSKAKTSSRASRLTNNE